MKSFTLLVLALATAGLVVAADAQTGDKPAGSSASGSVSTPSGSASGSVSSSPGSASGSTSPSNPGAPAADRPAARSESRSESRTDNAPATRNDDGAALPRSAVTERTTIFGLSPTAAVIIGAALLVVVILAIVAMTRTSDTYIDSNRRL